MISVMEVSNFYELNSRERKRERNYKEVVVMEVFW